MWIVSLHVAGPATSLSFFLCVLLGTKTSQGWMERMWPAQGAHRITCSPKDELVFRVICHPERYLFTAAVSLWTPHWETRHSAQPRGQHLPAYIGRTPVGWWGFASVIYFYFVFCIALIAVPFPRLCTLYAHCNRESCPCMAGTPLMGLLKIRTPCEERN